MTCARGCCWTPYGCSHARKCRCHWDELETAMVTDASGTHRDPTANTAIRNVIKGGK